LLWRGGSSPCEACRTSDLTDEEWKLLEPVFKAPGKRGRKHGDDLRSIVDAMLYIAQTGCRWRYLPESLGPWTRVWSQFRRWSRNGTWTRALTVLHAAAREADGRVEETPSMVVIDTHLARGASNGGFTFHDRGGPYGRTQGRQAHCGSRRDRPPSGRPGRAGLHPREPGQRADAGAPGTGGRHRPARAGPGGPWGDRGCCLHARPASRRRGPPGWVGRLCNPA
jgi:transposase